MPHYYEAKLLLLVWLLFGSGAEKLYRRVRRPLSQLEATRTPNPDPDPDADPNPSPNPDPNPNPTPSPKPTPSRFLFQLEQRWAVLATLLGERADRIAADQLASLPPSLVKSVCAYVARGCSYRALRCPPPPNRRRL